MFLLRSAFWLTIAFVLIAPRHGEDAAALAGKAIEAGKGAIDRQVLAADCQSLECQGGKLALHMLVAPSSPSAGPTMQVPGSPVPLPRPRPDRMG